MAAHVVAHHAEAAGQRGGLRLPHRVIGAQRVGKDDGGRGVRAIDGVEQPGAGVVEIRQRGLLFGMGIRRRAGPARRPRRHRLAAIVAASATRSVTPCSTARREAASTTWCASSRPMRPPRASIAASPRIRPCVRSRLARMRAASTSRPAATSPNWRSAPAARVTICGSVSHSACQPPSARSCSCTMPASIVATSGGTRTATVSTAAQPTGLRLCGIVLEPPRPGPDGSATSPTSVCIIRDKSRAILPSVPVSRPSAVATATSRSRWACQGSAGRSRPSSRANCAATAGALSPRLASVPAAPPNCSTRA
ncbi:hypothetical protein D3C85_1087380 [compost metagenome]